MMRRRSTPPPSPSVMLPISRGAYLLILFVALILYWVLIHYLERLDLTASLNMRWHTFLPGAPDLPPALINLAEFFDWRVLRHFIPVITGWVLAYLAAVSLVRVLYDLPDSGTARRFLGRLVGETAQGPAVQVSAGTVAKLRESSELLRVGGPGLILIPAGEVAVTEVNGRFYRVIPPGKQKIGRFEYIHALIDLRPQDRHLSGIRLVTRDGIEVFADATVTFRIDTGGVPATREAPFPYNLEAVRLAAYAEINRDGDLLFTWQDAPGNIARGVLAGVVARFSLDELLHPEGRREPNLALNQELQRQLRPPLEDAGIELIGTHIGPLTLPAEASQQYVDRWRADMDARARQTMAAGEADSLVALEIARAEAEVFMIQAIMEGLENARRAGGVGAMRDVVALRMVEALEKMARQSQQYQPLPDGLMPQLAALQRQLRAERSLPAQRKEGE